MPRRIHTPFLLAAAALVAAGCAVQAQAGGAVGEKAPGFTLTDLEGRSHSLADHEGKVVVLEWVNPNCPFSDRHAREKTMASLADRHGEVVWLGINSTNDDHRDYLQPAEHKAWADEHGVDYPILQDPSGEVGKAYDAKTTPHMYIIDQTGTIAYNGAIDDDPPGRREQAERTNYVGAGLVAHAADREIDPASTKPYGCSMKY